MVVLVGPDGPLFDPAAKHIDHVPPPAHLPAIIRRAAGRGRHLVVFDTATDIPPILVPKLIPNSIAMAVKTANIELPIYAPLSLKQEAITPALTLDEVGFNSVYIARGGPCAPVDQDVVLLRPCHGGEGGVDVNVVGTSSFCLGKS